MRRESLLPILQKLRVRSGLVGESKLIEGPWRVGFFYDRDGKNFELVLCYNAQCKHLPLAKDDVETRGRSMWMTSNTWRLSPSGMAKGESILKAVEATEARLKERKTQTDPSLRELEVELAYAKQDYRNLAQIEGRLTKDESAEKKRLEGRIRQLQKLVTNHRG